MYSVVVPCYNEAGNLSRLIERFDQIYRELCRAGKKLELVLVENGSKDNSHALITDIVKERDYVQEVRVEVNQGYGYGILQGLRACSGDFLFWLHADLQLPPEAILDMIGILDSAEDPNQMFIKATRKNRPLLDRFFTFGMSVFESIYLGTHLYDINAQPTCIPKSFFDSWVDPPYDFSLDLYTYCMAQKRGLQMERIPVVQAERTAGASSWNTGIASKMKLVKRTISYSRILKKELRQMRVL